MLSIVTESLSMLSHDTLFGDPLYAAIHINTHPKGNMYEYKEGIHIFGDKYVPR